ncbi:ribosomal protein S18-alanine N-acetyltransferase [Halothiobacillus sp. DCM-1]|uniref:ribosomal protein S18-alanine N-acetyltransferase n=1 Tax=Halothiobacillus sp. DCM-1 TaxID=3112558 RepID=UPI0032512817
MPSLDPPVILPLEREDLPRLMPIERAGHVYPWSERVFQDCWQSGYYLDGAFRANDLLGFSVVMPVLDEWHLLNLCVSPRVQRQGIGRSLLAYLLDQAEKAGVGSVWLEVRQSNDPAQQLYAAHGFEQVGRRRDYYPAPGGREDALVLTRRLQAG